MMRSPQDPEFQQAFGIGPGCSAETERAVPPVRVRDVVSTVSGDGNQFSVCASDYAEPMSALASGIVARLP